MNDRVQVPGYEVLEKLAAGASASVYRARSCETGEPVAIKVLSGRLFDAGATSRRFLREVRLQGTIVHENVLALHDAGFLEEQPYLIVELAEQGSLRDLMNRRGELALAEAVRIGAGIASGLHAAHEQGVTHRDLKPENVLLARDGTPKIADFGLAKGAPSTHSVETTAGTVLGTPSYVAPETVEGARPAPAADIYALGVMLYEMLADVPPFVGGDLMDLLWDKLNGTPMPLESIRPDVPPALLRLIASCMSRDPDARPAAGAVARQLILRKHVKPA